jgi:chromosome segregation ATPase
MGRFKEAIDVGARTTVAPLPGFAQAALVCVSTSDEIYKRVVEEQARGAARQRWATEIAAFGVQFDGISSAVAAQDWEQVISLEAAYNGRADALQTMAADGTVARAGGEADFAEASSDIAELKRILSKQKKQLDESRRALASLQSNPAYLDAAAQFASLSMTEGDQAGQVATLERTLAANQQPGPAQMQLAMQLESARDRLRETRRNLREILTRTNEMRRNLKLVPRDRP